MDQHGINWNYPDCDWPVTQELLGNAMLFVESGMFFDGQTLAAFAPEMIDSEQKERVVSKINVLKPKKVMVWGWGCGKIVDQIQGYQLIGLDLGENSNGLVRIDVERINFDHLKGRHWNAPTRIADEVSVETTTHNVSVNDLMRLLSLVLSRVENSMDRRYINLFEFWFDDKQSKTFLAKSRKTHLTLGFLTLRILNPGYCFIAWTATQSGTKYVSDSLYATAIKWALENKYSIDLGFGGTPSLLKFKKKWNPTSILSPKKQFLLQQT